MLNNLERKQDSLQKHTNRSALDVFVTFALTARQAHLHEVEIDLPCRHLCKAVHSAK